MAVHRAYSLLLSSAKSTIVTASPDYTQPDPSPSPTRRLSALREGGISWLQARSERAAVMSNTSFPINLRGMCALPQVQQRLASTYRAVRLSLECDRSLECVTEVEFENLYKNPRLACWLE